MTIGVSIPMQGVLLSTLDMGPSFKNTKEKPQKKQITICGKRSKSWTWANVFHSQNGELEGAKNNIWSRDLGPSFTHDSTWCYFQLCYWSR